MNSEGLGNWKRSSYCGDLRLTDEGREVTMMGWVHTRRDHGGLISSTCATVLELCKSSSIPSVAHLRFELAQDLRNESVLAVRGRVEPRPAETQNPNLATGAIEIMASKAKLLSRARSTPFPIDGSATITESTRLKFRYLTCAAGDPGETARLPPSSREGGSGLLRIAGIHRDRNATAWPHARRRTRLPGADRVDPGSFYALPQSPQLFDAVHSAIEQICGAHTGDLLMFVADTAKVVNDSLANLRLKLGDQLGMIPSDRYAFVWVTDFPLVEYSEEEKRLVSVNHPFTAAHEDDWGG